MGSWIFHLVGGHLRMKLGEGRGCSEGGEVLTWRRFGDIQILAKGKR